MALSPFVMRLSPCPALWSMIKSVNNFWKVSDDHQIASVLFHISLVGFVIAEREQKLLGRICELLEKDTKGIQ